MSTPYEYWILDIRRDKANLESCRWIWYSTKIEKLVLLYANHIESRPIRWNKSSRNLRRKSDVPLCPEKLSFFIKPFDIEQNANEMSATNTVVAFYFHESRWIVESTLCFYSYNMHFPFYSIDVHVSCESFFFAFDTAHFFYIFCGPFKHNINAARLLSMWNFIRSFFFCCCQRNFFLPNSPI